MRERQGSGSKRSKRLQGAGQRQWERFLSHCNQQLEESEAWVDAAGTVRKGQVGEMQWRKKPSGLVTDEMQKTCVQGWSPV